MFTLTVIGLHAALYTPQTLSLIKLLSNNHIFYIRSPLNKRSEMSSLAAVVAPPDRQTM